MWKKQQCMRNYRRGMNVRLKRSKKRLGEKLILQSNDH